MSKETPVKPTRGMVFGKWLEGSRKGHAVVDEKLIISEGESGQEIDRMSSEEVQFVLGELAKMQESARNDDNPKHLLSQGEKWEIAMKLGEEVMKNPSVGYRLERRYKQVGETLVSPDSKYYIKGTKPRMGSPEDIADDIAKDEEIDKKWEANKLLKDVLETGKRQSDVLKKLRLVTRKRSSEEENSHVAPLKPTNFSK